MPNGNITSELFDFAGQSPKLEWCVEPLVPLGQLVFNIAQSSSGKSWYGESIATCIAYGVPFLNLKTIEGDVLIIDQDTPVETLKRRLRRFGTYYGLNPKHKVHLLSMQGLSLRDDSLQAAIREHSNVVFVLIDCLHSICSGIDPDSTKDMNTYITNLKHVCLQSNRTIMINHHISEKLEATIEDLMMGNSHKYSMGSSAINQQADAYYILAQSQNTNGRLRRISIRPVGKKESIPLAPFTITLYDDDNEGSPLYFGNFVPYKPQKNSCAKDILQLLMLRKTPLTCKEIFDAQGQDYPQNEIRATLRILETEGILEKSTEAHNLFKYYVARKKEGQSMKLESILHDTPKKTGETDKLERHTSDKL